MAQKKKTNIKREPAPKITLGMTKSALISGIYYNAINAQSAANAEQAESYGEACDSLASAWRLLQDAD